MATLRQRPSEIAIRAATLLGAAIGRGLGGIVVDLISARATFIIGGSGVLLVTLLTLALFRRAAHPATSGRFLHDVVVANLTGYRHLRGRSQEDIATDMSGIDHPWSASTVSDVENGERSLSIDELGALAMVLETTIPALIDCGGVDGTDERDLQIGYGKLPAWFARTWLRGKVFPHVQRDTSGRLRLSGMGVATDTTPDPASVMAQGLLVLFGKRRKEAAS